MVDPPVPWVATEDELFTFVESRRTGLTTQEAGDRLRRATRPRRHAAFHSIRLVLRQFRSPIVLMLLATAALSFFLGETLDAMIVIGIVLTSGVLGFHQEQGAVRAVNDLIGTVTVHSDAFRDGQETRVVIDEVVPGDVIVLRVGDIVPGDCRVISSNRLYVNEAALTGENYPRHKAPGRLAVDTPLAERSNYAHFGTHVSSGEGVAVVVSTGERTEFGRVRLHINRQHVPTSFERGTTRFGYLLMRSTAVLVALVFLINVLLRRPVVDSLLFSLALAVGLTPQLLPAIITLSLSRGAVVMARKKVIVKRLDAIEDIGSLDVLCTDKTGTLTVGNVALRAAIGLDGSPSNRVATLARWNASLQTGFANPIDTAIVEGTTAVTDCAQCLGEIPFDFTRKRLTVWVESGGQSLLVTKGAVESVIGCCSKAMGEDGQVVPLESGIGRARAVYEAMSHSGLRVLAVAQKSMPPQFHLDAGAEEEMTLVGFLTFADPPKEGVASALGRLSDLGVSVRLITGDNSLAASQTALTVGLKTGQMVTGVELSKMTDEELQDVIESATVFCETDPLQKERIVRALSAAGHTVGFLGDGINDSPALHIADVGISVDSAVDIAKQTADLVLLDKDLGVLTDGIEQGRRVFANTLKYVYVNTSAQFGNMLSLAMAALVLPFLPLLPLQVLLLNFLSDIPGLTIATDRVDEEQLRAPRKWDVRQVRNFMVVFGTLSSVFDMVTFAILRLVFHAGPELLRTGWFIESTFTELAVMLVLRTDRPAFRSRPSGALIGSSVVVALVTIWTPFSFVSKDLGFISPGGEILATLMGITVFYVVTTEFVKQQMHSLYQSDYL